MLAALTQNILKKKDLAHKLKLIITKYQNWLIYEGETSKNINKKVIHVYDNAGLLKLFFYLVFL